jgi:hypothetical protein
MLKHLEQDAKSVHKYNKGKNDNKTGIPQFELSEGELQ